MNTTVVLANYNNPDLSRNCLLSIRKFYPDIPIIVVDDYSDADKFQLLQEYIKDISGTTYVRNECHLGHGISLDNGFRHAETKFVWTFDHDVVLLKENVLEFFLERIKSKDVVATGVRHNNYNKINYVHSMCAVWDKQIIDLYNLSFGHFSLEPKKEMATGQLLCLRLIAYGYNISYVENGQVNGVLFSHNGDRTRYSSKDYNYKINK